MKGEEAFKEYYKFNEETMNLLKTPQLKIFRINRSNKLHKRVESIIREAGCIPHRCFNELFVLPKEINYYKGWDNERKKLEFNTNKEKNLTENKNLTEDENLKKIKKLFSLLADSGLIYYQEISSFLPVYLLKVEKNHKVLDMCSAPGSKTTQLIELTDYLVANEPNYKRRSVLVTNTSKFNTKSLVITTYDGRFFPTQIKFDRILCDVPCSSDGTIRKDPSLLFDWSINKSIGISKLQKSILKRGIQLLKNDGILIYSTCTFNKVENEDVLESVLTDDYEIINVNHLLEGLSFVNGLTEKTRNAIRIIPNKEDTGGFFISLIRKKSEENKENSSSNDILVNNKINDNTNDKSINDESDFIDLLNYNHFNKKECFIKSSANSIRLINKEMKEILNYKVDLFGVKVFELLKINNNKIWRPLLLESDYLIDKETLLGLLKNELIIYKSDFIGFKGVFYEDINFICYFTGNKLKAYISNKYKEMLLALIFNEYKIK